MNRNRKIALILFGYLISLFLLFITFKDTNFTKVFEYLKKIDPVLVFIAFLLNIIFVCIRGVYQKNNLHITTPSLKIGTSIISIGIALFYNVILPSRLGHIVRAVFISLKDNIKKKRIIPYILTEKVIDLLLMMLFFILIVVIESEEQILSYMFVAALIIAVSIIIFILYIKYNEKVVNLIKSLGSEKFKKLISEINYEAINGMSYFKTKSQIFKSLVLLISGWLIILSIYFILSYPFVDQLKLPNYSAIYFLVFSAVALALPSAPAGFGTVHYGIYLAVQVLMNGSIPNNQIDLVAALIISLHLLIILLDVIVGGLILLIYRQKGEKKFVKDKLLW